MSLIALQNLTKKYPRGVTALDGLGAAATTAAAVA